MTDYTRQTISSLKYGVKANVETGTLDVVIFSPPNFSYKHQVLSDPKIELQIELGFAKKFYRDFGQELEYLELSSYKSNLDLRRNSTGILVKVDVGS